MKIAICDDESWFIRIITNYIEIYRLTCDEPLSIHTYQDPEILITDCRSMEYDILYLDIELENANGIEVAQRIRENSPNLLIIFVTSHPQYVQKSYTVKAFQYLSKPVEDSEFFMNELTRAIDEVKGGQVTFEFNLDNGIRYVQTNEILYLSTSYKTFKLQTVDDSHFGNIKTVKKTRDLLPKYNFYKIHRSTTINMAHVVKFDRDFVTMDNDEILPISREKTKDFRRTFLRYKNVCNVDI